MGEVVSAMSEAMISAPRKCVVLVQGTWKDANSAPFGVREKFTGADLDTCLTGSKLADEMGSNSPKRQQHQNATHATAKTAASNEHVRSSPRNRACICSMVTGGRFARLHARVRHLLYAKIRDRKAMYQQWNERFFRPRMR